MLLYFIKSLFVDRIWQLTATVQNIKWVLGPPPPPRVRPSVRLLVQSRPTHPSAAVSARPYACPFNGRLTHPSAVSARPCPTKTWHVIAKLCSFTHDARPAAACHACRATEPLHPHRRGVAERDDEPLHAIVADGKSLLMIYRREIESE